MTQKIKRKESKDTTREIIKSQKKRAREKRNYRTARKQQTSSKSIHSNYYFKWTKFYDQKTE